MLIRKNDQPTNFIENGFGGHGKIEFRNFLEPKDAAGSGRKFAVTTMQPGVSLGYHSHSGEYEIYLMLSGVAKVKDDGEEYLMYPGDMMQCKSGSSHSIENPGPDPVEFIALIIYNHE